MGKGIFIINAEAVENLSKELTRFYHKALRNKIKSLTFILITDKDVNYWVPEIRDVILSNIAIGMKFYVLSPKDINKLKEILENEISCNVSLKIAMGLKDINHDLSGLLKNLSFEVV